MSKPVLEPSAKHPITVTPTSGEVVVSVKGQEVARSGSSLSLAEADYPVVQYVPIADVDQSLLRPSDTSTYCPYKGDASYYSIALPDGSVVADAVWYYADPRPAVTEIKDHVAFYTDRTDVSVG